VSGSLNAIVNQIAHRFKFLFRHSDVNHDHKCGNDDEKRPQMKSSNKTHFNRIMRVSKIRINSRYKVVTNIPFHYSTNDHQTKIEFIVQVAQMKAQNTLNSYWFLITQCLESLAVFRKLIDTAKI
jgi:hypothetical protein